MKLGIKTKILAATILVVTISLVCSGTFAYYYFLKIFKEKAIQDDTVKMSQLCQQLEYQIDDLTKLGLAIIVSPEVQNYVKHRGYSGYYERMSQANLKLDYLSKQLFLREYIHSAAIINSEGAIWYSITNPNLDAYFQAKLQEKWFQQYRDQHEPFYFSDPFPISNVTRGTPTTTVISCIVQFRNIDEPDQKAGLLFINVYLDYFQKYLKTNSGDYDGFLWINHQGTSMFHHGALPESQLKRLITLHHNPAISHLEKFKGIAIVSQPLSNGWRLVSYTSNKRLFHRIRFIFYFFLFFTLVSLGLIILIVLPVILRITRPLTQLTRANNQVATGNLDILLDISSGDEIEALAKSFNQMTRDLQKYLAQSVENEKIKREMEFQILLSQVNPHFIYNVLNTIIYMARREKNHNIAALTDSFVRILQDGIKVGDHGLVITVREEMEVVDHYITIQQYRYPDRFTLSWNVAPEYLECLIPKTLIQPLVENALFHGICPKDGPGRINVAITGNGSDILLKINDDGIGMDPGMIQKLLQGENIYEPETKLRPIGLANIRDRIRFIYGENYGMTIQSAANEGTRIEINLPFRKQASESQRS